MIKHLSFCLLILTSLFFPLHLLATNYYVDFEEGADINKGTTPTLAFKHSPGDPDATAIPKDLKLQPGDTVIFKGGVAYKGVVKITASGSTENPITFDGNTAGKFGVGKAIIEGGEPLAGWKRCASAAEAGGNLRWADIFYTDIPKPADWKTVNLCDGESVLPIAQLPKMKNPFFQETTDEYFVSSEQIRMVSAKLTFVDANFNPPNPDYYKGMFCAFISGNNIIHYEPVEAYDPVAHQLTMSDFSANPYDSGDIHKFYKTTHYSFFNSVKLISQPGEYSVESPGNATTARVFLLPPKLKHDLPADIAYGGRKDGLTMDGAKNIILHGFLVHRQSGRGIWAANGSNIVIRDCEVALVNGGCALGAMGVNTLLVEKCYVHHNPGHTRGIILHTCSNATTRDCTVFNNSCTGIDYYHCTDGHVVGNKVIDQKGQHSNGITFYLTNKNMLLEKNYVAGGSSALTFKDIENFVIRNNVLDSNCLSSSIGMWTDSGPDSMTKNVQILNNTMVRSSPVDWTAAIFSNNTTVIEGLVVKNNIIDGIATQNHPSAFDKGDFSNNLFTRKGAGTTDAMLKNGAFEPDIKKIFVDPDNGNFNLKPGSPAIGLGADVGLTEDMAGVKLAKNKYPDVGAYQFVP